MKYIMFTQYNENGTVLRKVPIIFPNALTHALIAEALSKSEELTNSKVTSAGEFSSFDLAHIAPTGHSESLGVGTDPDDLSIIRTYDYTHGLL